MGHSISIGAQTGQEITMPYVTQKERNYLEPIINELVDELQNTPMNKRGGSCNYAVCTLLLRALKPEMGWNYAALSNVIGTLECAKQEIYTRLVAPYELKAVERNGDLTDF